MFDGAAKEVLVMARKTVVTLEVFILIFRLVICLRIQIVWMDLIVVIEFIDTDMTEQLGCFYIGTNALF